jgi:hypothetical protein
LSSSLFGIAKNVSAPAKAIFGLRATPPATATKFLPIAKKLSAIAEVFQRTAKRFSQGAKKDFGKAKKVF